MKTSAFCSRHRLLLAAIAAGALAAQAQPGGPPLARVEEPLRCQPPVRQRGRTCRPRRRLGARPYTHPDPAQSWSALKELLAQTTTQNALAFYLAHVAASRSYRAVAAAGFLLATGVKDAEVITFFELGTAWLMKKALAVDGILTGVAVDGLAVLGIALGQIKVGAISGFKEWVILCT